MNEPCGHSDLCSNCGRPTTKSDLVCPTFDDTKWRHISRSGGELSDAERLVLEAEHQALLTAAVAHAREVDARQRELDKMRSKLTLLWGQIDQCASLLH